MSLSRCVEDLTSLIVSKGEFVSKQPLIDIRALLVELRKSPNTGSPKLPPCTESCEVHHEHKGMLSNGWRYCCCCGAKL
jgi:hypothetical protein